MRKAVWPLCMQTHTHKRNYINWDFAAAVNSRSAAMKRVTESSKWVLHVDSALWQISSSDRIQRKIIQRWEKLHNQQVFVVVSAVDFYIFFYLFYLRFPSILFFYAFLFTFVTSSNHLLMCCYLLVECLCVYVHILKVYKYVMCIQSLI